MGLNCTTLHFDSKKIEFKDEIQLDAREFGPPPMDYEMSSIDNP
jgi:hypothetical protein